MNNNININDFGVLLADSAKDILGDGYSVECKEVIKNNGVAYHAVVIRKNSGNIAPTIYIDEYYREYLKGKKVTAITDHVIKLYHESEVRGDFDVEFFTDFSKVCKFLSFKAVNLERNRQILTDIPYRQIEDLALIPICRVNSDIFGSGCITIHNQHVKAWEVSDEELWENIFESTFDVAPVNISTISENVGGVLGMVHDDVLDNILVVSNKEMRFGAGAVFYPGVLKMISERLNSDLVIIPSSVHETIVMPSFMASSNEYTLSRMISEVNDSVVSDEEILSDNAYYYDADDETVRIFEEK